jgi:hypothetical protein
MAWERSQQQPTAANSSRHQPTAANSSQQLLNIIMTYFMSYLIKKYYGQLNNRKILEEESVIWS